jgi:hypothetical protein
MADRFDKFTERARRVLTLAQTEALRFDHNYIGTEHLLLGLVRERDGVAAHVLANLRVELIKVRSAVEFIIGHGDRAVMGEIGLTPRAKKVIELAVDEARRLNHHYIGTEHLLLGLVREGEGIAAGVLESLGVSLERVRAETTRILSQSVTPSGSAPPDDVGFDFFDRRVFRTSGVMHDTLQTEKHGSIVLPVAFGIVVAFVVGYAAADDGWATASIYLGAAAASLVAGWIAWFLLRTRQSSLVQASGAAFQMRSSAPLTSPTSQGPLDDSDLAEQRSNHRNTPIEDLNLSVRAYNCLKRNGLMTVGQILAKSEDELLALRNFGRKSYDELIDKLIEIGVLRRRHDSAFQRLDPLDDDTSALG